MNNEDNTNYAPLDGFMLFQSDEINHINIKLLSACLDIIARPVEDIKLEFYGRNCHEYFKSVQINEELEIKQTHHFSSNSNVLIFNLFGKSIIRKTGIRLIIPSTKQINIAVEDEYSYTSIRDIHIPVFTFKQGNGVISLKNITSDALHIRSKNGVINVSYGSISGKIECKNGVINYTEASLRGDLDIVSKNGILNIRAADVNAINYKSSCKNGLHNNKIDSKDYNPGLPSLTATVDTGILNAR